MKNYKHYLYAAAVQGIQNFILQSDELRDIIGASELIEIISTDSFNDFGKEKDQEVQMAAGIIKYVFNNKEDCENAVLNFPKKVMEKAPGITVSQAVVGYNEDAEFVTAMNEIEEKLKSQRNKPVRTDPVFMSMRRSRQTGMPVVEIIKNEYLDEATVAKRKSTKRGDNPVMKLSKICFGMDKTVLSHDRIPYNIEEITHKNDWLAIIHADGNGLGQIVQKVGKNKNDFREFSFKLNEATEEAAKIAYGMISEKYKFDDIKTKIIPIRPVVLGGDDFTVICRADFAMEYTEEFLKAFEKTTHEKLKHILEKHKDLGDRLTACAGISYIKSSFPFYYGYELADSLCKEAKKEAKSKIRKSLTPSCIMFHKVMDSFVIDYKDIKKRELTLRSKKTFKYGPYYTDTDNGASISELLENVEILDNKEGNAVKSHLRNWLSDMVKNEAMAEQRKKRLMSNLAHNKKLKDFVNKITSTDKIATYDILSLHSIMYNQTKNEA